MNLLWGVAFLAASVVAGVLIRVITDALAPKTAEPENSHPGRVVPRGVPIMRALKEDRRNGDESAATSSPPVGAGVALGYEPAMGPYAPAMRRPVDDQASNSGDPRTQFRHGQWVRRLSDGALVEYMCPSLRPGQYAWVLSAGRSAALCWEADLEFAVPREGEWWRKGPCQRDHVDPPGGWAAGPVRWRYNSGERTESRLGASRARWDALFAAEACACWCGCLEPVGHGRGEPAA